MVQPFQDGVFSEDFSINMDCWFFMNFHIFEQVLSPDWCIKLSIVEQTWLHSTKEQRKMEAFLALSIVQYNERHEYCKMFTKMFTTFFILSM